MFLNSLLQGLETSRKYRCRFLIYIPSYEMRHTLLSFPSADIKSAHSLEYSKFFSALSTAATQFLYLESLSNSSSSVFILPQRPPRDQFQSHVKSLPTKTKFAEGTKVTKQSIKMGSDLVVNVKMYFELEVINTRQLPFRVMEVFKDSFRDNHSCVPSQGEVAVSTWGLRKSRKYSCTQFKLEIMLFPCHICQYNTFDTHIPLLCFDPKML